jgi:hypothetical protein
MRTLYLLPLLAGAVMAAMPRPVAASSVTAVVQVPANMPTPLTSRKPAHGFQVSIGPNSNPFNECWIEDDTAKVGMPDAQVGIPIGMGYSNSNSQIGLSAVYQTPAGYEPTGIVYADCSYTTYLEIKTW